MLIVLGRGNCETFDPGYRQLGPTFRWIIPRSAAFFSPPPPVSAFVSGRNSGPQASAEKSSIITVFLHPGAGNYSVVSLIFRGTGRD